MRPLAELQTIQDFEEALTEAQAAFDTCPHIPGKFKHKEWKITHSGSRLYINGSSYTKKELRDLVSLRRERILNPTMEEATNAMYPHTTIRAMVAKLKRLREQGMINPPSAREW